MKNVGAIVLAAGKGTRMKSKKPKVVFQLADKALVQRVVETTLTLNSSLTCVVVGYKKEQVINFVKDYKNIAIAEQTEQLGTGHAVMMTENVFKDFTGDIFILCGDVPLTTKETLQGLLDAHRESGAACTVLTNVMDDPAHYGRIVRDANGHIDSIVEYKDASDKQRSICEINTGIYVFKKEKLFDALSKIDNNNVQHEYYLPDTLKVLNNEEEIVAGHVLENFVEAAGINSQEQLAQLEDEYYNNIRLKWLRNGVSIENPSSVIIGDEVVIDSDVIIEANSVIKGKSTILSGTKVGVNSLIKDSTIGENSKLSGYNLVINSSVPSESILTYGEKIISQ